MTRNTRFQNRDGRKPMTFNNTHSKPMQATNCQRLERFARFLENRGCPVKLVYRQSDTEIRWLD